MFEKIFSLYPGLEPAPVKVLEKPDCLVCECQKYGLNALIDREVCRLPLQTRKQRQRDRDAYIAKILAWSKTPESQGKPASEPKEQ